MLYKVYYGKRKSKYNVAWIRACDKEAAAEIFKVYNPDKNIVCIEEGL